MQNLKPGEQPDLDSRNAPRTWRSGPWPWLLMAILCMFGIAVTIVLSTQGAPPTIPK